MSSSKLAGTPCAGSGSVNTVNNCPASPVTYPAGVGQVSSYSLVDSKIGSVLGLDTNTAPAQAGAGALDGYLADADEEAASNGGAA